MHALHQEIIAPSGVEFAVSLNLTPSTLNNGTPVETKGEDSTRVISNLVVARSNFLRIFEVREVLEVGRSVRKSDARKDTEAVEGEVEMDEQGDGFVNMGSAEVNIGYDCRMACSPRTRLEMSIREYLLIMPSI